MRHFCDARSRGSIGDGRRRAAEIEGGRPDFERPCRGRRGGLLRCTRRQLGRACGQHQTRKNPQNQSRQTARYHGLHCEADCLSIPTGVLICRCSGASASRAASSPRSQASRLSLSQPGSSAGSSCATSTRPRPRSSIRRCRRSPKAGSSPRRRPRLPRTVPSWQRPKPRARDWPRPRSCAPRQICFPPASTRWSGTAFPSRKSPS